MKKQKIYEFAIDDPLTPAKRKAVEKEIKNSAHLSPNSVSYAWDGPDRTILVITANPVLIEVKFLKRKVELYGSAPLWARLLFTKRRKAELKDHIEALLRKSKFITGQQPKDKAERRRKNLKANGRARAAPTKAQVTAA